MSKKNPMPKRTKTISLRVPEEVHALYYSHLNEPEQKKTNIDIVAVILRHAHMAAYDAGAEAVKLMSNRE